MRPPLPITGLASSGAPSLVGDLLIPAFVALIAGSVGAAVITQLFAAADRRREHYAEAVAGLLSWCECPYMVRRRVDDNPDTLQRLADHAHQLQERIARSEAWVTTENAAMGARYSQLISEVKAGVSSLLNDAWASEPIANPSEMVLGGWGRDECASAQKQIRQFRTATARRFGWRRLLWIRRQRGQAGSH